MLTGRAAQLVLSPVLAAQALQVIRKTPRLPEAAGPRTGSSGTGRPLRLLILGDSSAAGVGAHHQQDALSGQLVQALSGTVSLHWRLIAQTGITTRAIPDMLRNHGRAQFDVAVTALGVNDVTRLVSPKRWSAQTRLVHDILKRDFGVQRIYGTAIPPIAQFPALPNPLGLVLGKHAAAMMARLTADLAPDATVRMVEPKWGFDPTKMARDGFHPGPETYARWGAEMAHHILAGLPDGAS
ncbi:SGNH/GDSL hydrolase family protein [uncultured Roseobacter sp.]|uniref:SGNH/GDSL hydrolase family protein n=1 Tax=uncultured Roseobacter sp. TaxID=114847 RepID=UPI0026067268|nr:SGNH/GDSL hydrolase family protein [uncultured Roseobacter sp.]